MATLRNSRRMCRQCGAELNISGDQCWFCHRQLTSDDILLVERKATIAENPDNRREKLRDAVTPEPPDPGAQATINVSAGAPVAFWEVGEIYEIGRYITSFIVIIISWIYAIVTYGLFLGVGLGWIPSVVIGFLVGFLWPLIALVIVAAIIAILVVIVGEAAAVSGGGCFRGLVLCRRQWQRNSPVLWDKTR